MAWRSTTSSPRTGILSLIRFDLGQNWGRLGGPRDFSGSTSPFGLDFGALDSDFGLGLDN